MIRAALFLCASGLARRGECGLAGDGARADESCERDKREDDGENFSHGEVRYGDGGCRRSNAQRRICFRAMNETLSFAVPLTVRLEQSGETAERIMPGLATTLETHGSKTRLFPPEQPFDVAVCELYPRRAAVVALPRMRGDFHLAEQRVHFGD